MSDTAPRVLVLIDYFLPGYKGGGPLRSVQGIVEQLGDGYEFRVVTRDRDAGERAPYPIATGGWQEVGGFAVCYVRAGVMAWWRACRTVRDTPHEILFLNSVFSPQLTIAPLIMRAAGFLPPSAVVLAPRGELHPGALGTGGLLRRAKKRAYLALARAANLFRGVVWQVSNNEERAHVRMRMPDAVVEVAPNLAPREQDTGGERPTKRPGALRLVFLSRITEKKNLAFAIELLRDVTGDVTLDIYGPAEDAAYWARCQAAIATLPPHVSVHYHGALPHDRLADALRPAHVMLFPTLGENFGHVLREALVHGVPVLVSDRTPWRGLRAERAGWDLSLGEPDAFREALSEAIAMDDATYRAWSAGARALGRRRSLDPEARRRQQAVFARATTPTETSALDG